MEQMTFRVPDDVIKHVESEAEDHSISKSKIARELLERGIEYNELQNEVDRLRNQLQATNDRNEIDDKLVKYVENDIEYHEADLLTKARWFIFGK